MKLKKNLSPSELQIARTEMKLDLLLAYLQQQRAVDEAITYWERLLVQWDPAAESWGQKMLVETQKLNEIVAKYKALNTPGEHPLSRSAGEQLSDGSQAAP